jgi:hypothetical protein
LKDYVLLVLKCSLLILKKWVNYLNDELEQILISELGYSKQAAKVTAHDLNNLDPYLKVAFTRWLTTRETDDITVATFSALKLMRQKAFSYPAALVALDWLIKEPVVAAKELSKKVVK